MTYTVIKGSKTMLDFLFECQILLNLFAIGISSPNVHYRIGARSPEKMI